MREFIELHALANDPEAFAKLRHELLQSYLNAIPPGRRSALIEFQKQIDLETAVTANPLRTANRLVGMITDRVSMFEKVGMLLSGTKRNTRPEAEKQ